MKSQGNSDFSSRWNAGKAPLFPLPSSSRKFLGTWWMCPLLNEACSLFWIYSREWQLLGHAVVKDPLSRSVRIPRPAGRGFMAIQGPWRTSLLGAHKPPARLIAGTRSKDIPAWNSPEQAGCKEFLTASCRKNTCDEEFNWMAFSSRVEWLTGFIYLMFSRGFFMNSKWVVVPLDVKNSPDNRIHLL